MTSKKKPTFNGLKKLADEGDEQAKDVYNILTKAVDEEDTAVIFGVLCHLYLRTLHETPAEHEELGDFASNIIELIRVQVAVEMTEKALKLALEEMNENGLSQRHVLTILAVTNKEARDQLLRVHERTGLLFEHHSKLIEEKKRATEQ